MISVVCEEVVEVGGEAVTMAGEIGVNLMTKSGKAESFCVAGSGTTMVMGAGFFTVSAISL